jgi:hypothetical protein
MLLLATFAPTAALAAPLPQYAGLKPDAIAFIKNGYRPVIVPESQMTPSSIPGLITERGPDRTIPNCHQPPAGFDPTTATTAQLTFYGYPLPISGQPIARWRSIVSQMKIRDCATYATNKTPPLPVQAAAQAGVATHDGPFTFSASQEYRNDIWTGKVADQSCGSTTGPISCIDYTHDYSEIDSDYYINCPTLYLRTDWIGSAIWIKLGMAGPGWYEP